MSKLLQSLSQMLFPNLCVCCDGYLTHQEGSVCDLCFHGLPKFENFMDADNAVAKKFWGRLKLECATSFLQFKTDGDVRKILHQIKYKGNMDLGVEMGEALGKFVLKVPELVKADAILPIPLHPKRQIERGYNQSDLLSRGMADIMGKTVHYNALVRKKHNSTQTKKKRYERFINSKEIFRVELPQLLENKHVILLDDVITTGATIEACGNALLEVDGLKLSVVSLAVAT
jgi:ComF family protein